MPFGIKIERQTVLTYEPHLTALSFMTKQEIAVVEREKEKKKNND